MSFVSGASSVNSATSQSPNSPTTTTPAIDSSGFLRLLVTQLQHQDPSMPTDPGDTVLQLAALSQVSTLQEISALLKQLVAAQQNPSERSSISDEQKNSNLATSEAQLRESDESADLDPEGSISPTILSLMGRREP